jgi:DNA-binding XRE family transcriptional regulator
VRPEVDKAHALISQFFDVMNHAAFNYVRTFRQRHGLSECELAFLINHRSHTAISLMEVGRRAPSLSAALALEILFRQSPRQMFPGLYEAVEDGLMRRAHALLKELEDKDDPRSDGKRDFLEGLAGEGGNDGPL